MIYTELLYFISNMRTFENIQNFPTLQNRKWLGEWRKPCFRWFVGTGEGDLHGNYTGWEEFQYDKNKE